jgi:phosphoribosylamine--glycine ligase
MKVLVVGGGGREHALAWALSRSSGVEQVLCAPGNAGTSEVAENIDVGVGDVAALVDAARTRGVGLVVVGPEAPLVAGLADALEQAGIATFGPGLDAAQLEGSKAFSKRFMARHDIPTAGFEVFDDAARAEAYVRERNCPLVVKADGLAAGKGVVVCDGPDDAVEAVQRIMRDRAFGDAGGSVVIEERLVGEEVSFHVVADGERWLPLAAAQDHKRAFEGDKGPNTGGMGAYSPPPVVTPEVERKILERVVTPTMEGLKADGMRYRGVIFIGLMIVDGEPSVLEYNVRFGDPEAEALFARLGSDVLPLLLGAARGELGETSVSWEAPASMCVVAASGGYPGKYATGKAIEGLAEAGRLEGVTVFHAGTRREGDQVLTSGGRVLTVTAHGKDIDEAAARAYAGVDVLRFDGMHVRRDIGWRARRL